MGFDLTNERIQDTYEQLVQISGSKLVDGTGSLITPDITTVSASYAVTASYALNGGGTDIDTGSLVTTSSFNAYTSSNDAKVDSLTSATSSYLTSADITGKLDTSVFNAYTSSNDAKVDSLTSATSSYLTSVPSGTVSSSAQVDLSLATGIADTASKIEISNGVGKTLNLVGIDELGYATLYYGGPTILGNGLNIGSITSSNALISNDLIVNGTASFAYLESITGSAKIIGDAYIILNNNTPTERYAGIVVQDSGSTNNTASLEFDGQTNDWFYEYTDDGGVTTEFGTVMFGPGYNTKGSHVYPSNNTILKGTGDHHMVDSSITDDGINVIVGTDQNNTLQVGSSGPMLRGNPDYISTFDDAGLFMNAGFISQSGDITADNNGLNTISNFLRVSSQDGNFSRNFWGGGAPSIGGNRRFVFANGSSTSADDSVILGGESNDISTSYVGMFGTSGTNINGGDLSVVVGGYQHTISAGARNVIIGGQGVTNNQDYAIVLGRTSFTTPSPYTTYTANLDVSGSVVVSGSGITFSDGTTQTTAAGAAGLVSGTGADSIRSSDDLTTTPAAAAGDNAIALGDSSDASGVSAVAIGDNPTADTVGAIAIGHDASARSDYAISIGDTSKAWSPNSIAIGHDVNVQSSRDSIMIGDNLFTAYEETIIIGQDITAAAVGEINIGGKIKIASAQDTIAIGRDAGANNTYGIAIGFSSYGSGSGAISIGQSSEARGDNSVAIGSNIITTEDNEINIRSIFTYNSASNGEISLKSNVETTGQIYSPTHAGSVASSTSSIDFDNGNFATLDCSAGATYIDNPSNLKSGTTYTLIITNGANISNYNTSWKFAGGTQPTLSSGTDILTCVSDGTNLYATALADFS